MDKTKLAERIESDLIGPLAIPRHVLYGVHTRRAEQNFDVSGLRLRAFPELIQSMELISELPGVRDTLTAFALSSVIRK